MNVATWVLGTALPGLAVLIGALKWLVRQEMSSVNSKLEQHTSAQVEIIEDINTLQRSQNRQTEKLDRLMELMLRKSWKA